VLAIQIPGATRPVATVDRSTPVSAETTGRNLAGAVSTGVP